MEIAATSMHGKICLITGATSGIGAVTAMELARLGATTVVAGRNRRKCEATVRSIRRKTGNPRVEWMLADLSSQAQIRRLAGEFKNRHDRLDVLVNNAGAYFMKRQLTADGLEMTFALNHIGYFLLTNLLLDSLKASASARIVVVASSAHKDGEMKFDDLQGERYYERSDAYGRSKLANVLFTYEIARRLEGTHVTANAVDPGPVATNIGSNNNWLRARLRNLLKPGMLTPEAGARTVIYVAASPDVEGTTGRYFYQEKQAASSDASHDPSLAKRLWEVSEELTGAKFPA